VKEKMYLARIVSTIYWKGETVNPGREIKVTGSELRYLGPCAVTVSVLRQEDVETATVRPAENTMRQRSTRR